MLLCCHHAFQRTDYRLPPFLSIFSPALAFVCLLRFEKISFPSPSTSNGCCSSSFFLDLHQTTQSFDYPIFFDQCSCSDSDKLSHTSTVGPSSSPQNFWSPHPADWKKGGADITASPSSLLALLIFCSARSIDHVGDLYPAFSFSSVRLVSSWMTMISSCSQSDHRFREKIQLLLAIVHPLCGPMHVVRPSVVHILVLPRCSSQSSNSARILLYPPFGISRSKNHMHNAKLNKKSSLGGCRRY